MRKVSHQPALCPKLDKTDTARRPRGKNPSMTFVLVSCVQVRPQGTVAASGKAAKMTMPPPLHGQHGLSGPDAQLACTVLETGKLPEAGGLCCASHPDFFPNSMTML